jgi:uncharacterized glyoxalase superfamily protein PhnB
MRSNRSAPAATVIPVLSYPDVRAAVAFLIDAFGFRERVRVGEDHRAQMRLGDDGDLIVADTGSERAAPVPHQVTASVMVRVEDVRAHCAHARTHGAVIEMEPTDFPYGERQYQASDPAGHVWTFTETLADVAPEDWGGQSVGEP